MSWLDAIANRRWITRNTARPLVHNNGVEMQLPVAARNLCLRLARADLPAELCITDEDGTTRVSRLSQEQVSLLAMEAVIAWRRMGRRGLGLPGL